jgi:hypothetical protein
VGPFRLGKIDFSQHDLCLRNWSCYLCQTHLFNSKLRVQLHDGAANWWSSNSRAGLAESEPCQTRPKTKKKRTLYRNAIRNYRTLLLTPKFGKGSDLWVQPGEKSVRRKEGFFRCIQQKNPRSAICFCSAKELLS